ncbi:MAG: hypothetical protein AAFV07_01215 [Bacteroidota bacterium]
MGETVPAALACRDRRVFSGSLAVGHIRALIRQAHQTPGYDFPFHPLSPPLSIPQVLAPPGARNRLGWISAGG